jgi:hypothetical protein
MCKRKRRSEFLTFDLPLLLILAAFLLIVVTSFLDWKETFEPPAEIRGHEFEEEPIE